MKILRFWPLLALLVACDDSGTSSSSEISVSDPVIIQGISYKTTVIGKQTWLARNLDIETAGSLCYDNLPSNCETYGRMYPYSDARTLCPEGWHLPSVSDFETLFQASGHLRNGSLKANRLWTANPGPDTYGFGALPAGDGYVEDGVVQFAKMGQRALFWTSTPSQYEWMEGSYSVRGVYDEGIDEPLTEVVGGFDDDTTSYHSVRCVKD